MESFPTNIRKPDKTGYSEGIVGNPSIQSTSEDGIIHRRAKYTKVCLKWSLQFTWLTLSEKQIIDDFVNTKAIFGIDFLWKNPLDGKTYTVFIPSKEPPTETKLNNSNELYWNKGFTFYESFPNSGVVL